MRRTHGESRTKLYNTWVKIKARCRRPSDPCYRHYGGRGIGMCDEWADSYETFRRDVGYPPTGAHQIDRIDNDGHYEPGNVRWVTAMDQAQNKRNVPVLSAFGLVMSVPDWARCADIPRSTLYKRLKLGWDVEDALTRPIIEAKRNMARRMAVSG